MAPAATTTRWRRPVPKVLLVLALTAATLVVLGALSGAARADVGDLLGPTVPDELAGSDDARIRPSGIVEARAGADGAEARVDVAGTRLHASVSADDGDVALFLEITPIVEEQPDDPRSPERPPHARQMHAAGEHEGPARSSGVPRTGWGRDAASSGPGRDDDHGAPAPARPPLGQPPNLVSGSTGRATTTSSAHDGPDVPGFLERFCFHRDGPGRPMTSTIAVFTYGLVPSTGPPG
jgi:hypothetical protein